ncbi:MAG: hypothetical protein IKU68_08140 [Oscillospiraceae bacterium]|nr:hypothetical protein [Oscillospiraceae bacterium]
MFDDPKKELRRLQEQLLAEEEDDYEEYEEEDEDVEDYDDDLDLDAIDELLEDDEEEEEPRYHNFANRYGRGSPKEFDYLEDDDEFDDDAVLYREDYRRGKRKKKKGNLGWVIIAFLEVIAIAAIALWWLSWMK